MNLSEEQLVKEARRGDRDALVTLLNRVAPEVRRAVDGSIAHRFQALVTVDDVMQQAYTDAFLHIQRFRNEGAGSFARWLTTLAKRNCVDAIRQLQAAKRGGRQDRLVNADDSVASLIDQVAGISRTPSRVVAGDEAGSVLREAITQLPQVYQHVVQRLDLDGAAAADVAEELQRSVGAVYMIRARAHDRLGEILGSASRFLSDGA